MVPAMAGLLRSARPCVVALLTLALVLGINGFVGAIHSVHHLPAQAHAHDEQGGGPGGTPDETCPVAAAASHIAATAVEPPPVLGPVSALARLGTPGLEGAPRIAWREPGSGRAPPSPRSLAS
jgi:hypothetical protein